MAVLFGALALFFATLWTVRVLRDRRRHRALIESLEQRCSFLGENASPRSLGGSWDRVCRAYNDWLQECRRLGEEQRNRQHILEAALDHLVESVIVIDSEDRLVLSNRSFLRLFPHAAADTPPRVQKILPSPSFYRLLDDLRREAGERSEELEFPAAATGGGTLWLRATGRCLTAPDGALSSGLLLILSDISREREIEGFQKDFVANVSHELRTPISVIRGYAETLAEDDAKLSLDERRRFLGAILRHSQRLASLVEDLLAISRIDSKYPDLLYEDVSIDSLLSGLAAEFGTRAQVGGQTLELRIRSEGLRARADPMRLSQVFENLLDNALRYTPRGTHIALCASRTGDEILLSVEDNGPGIPEKDLPRIFERFYRVEKGRSREKGGTGLGLSIAHAIVRLHGGRIWVESGSGKGTRFSVALPEAGDSGRSTPGAPTV